MRIARILALALVVPLVVGCSSQRPLPTVRERGDRAFEKGQFEQARVEYQEYVTRKPGEAAVELQLARTLLELDQPHDALTHAQEAFDLRPGEEEYIETYADALLGTQKTDQLYRFLRGLAQDRGQVNDYIRLGRFTARAGDADGAVQAFSTAARIDRGRTIAPQLAFAEFYREIGDTEHEKERLRMALSFDVKNPVVLGRLRELGEIPGPSLALTPAEAAPDSP
jgi:tetratricopeptide (TPR) repeat protein